jgi:ATP-dependent DNA helicase PIF1
MTGGLQKYASSLPYKIKINILKRLPYDNIRWVSDPDFWIEYWKYNTTPVTDTFVPNPEQEYVLRLIESGKNIFINAPAGTGKSALIKHYVETNKQNQLIGLTSTTGISALNIGGSTLHSFLGIGLGNDDVEDLYDKIIRNNDKRDLWLKLKLLIIDEISMLHPDLFNKLEKVARLVRENKLKFGGIQLVVTGDLFQLPCVSQNSTLIIHSKKFNRCIDQTIELRNIVRQVDSIFKNVLNKIRVGVVDYQVKEILSSRFKILPSEKVKPTKLFCTRRSVADLNEKSLNKLAKQGFEFREYEMTFKEEECAISFDYIVKNFIKNSTTPITLQVCENTQVMLTYNIGPTLVNGSRGIITGFTPEDYPVVQWVNGTASTVKPIKFNLFHTLRNGKVKQVGYATQIPLKIAYALTIHSCQGSTLDCVSIDLSETFEYGQAYTALSRVRTLEGLYLKKFKFDVIKAHPEALKFMQKINNF